MENDEPRFSRTELGYDALDLVQVPLRLGVAVYHWPGGSYGVPLFMRLRVEGLGFGVQGLGCGVWGLGCRV